MKTFEEQFAAWVDGTLTGEELAAFERELAARPDAIADKAAALKLGSLLRNHPTAPTLANPEFFNLHLMRQIEADQPRKQPQPEKARGWRWTMPRLAWAGAACLLVAFALFETMIPRTGVHGEKSTYFAQVIEAWPADSSISATTVYNPEDDVTVLWLDGLDYIPAKGQL